MGAAQALLESRVVIPRLVQKLFALLQNRQCVEHKPRETAQLVHIAFMEHDSA